MCGGKASTRALTPPPHNFHSHNCLTVLPLILPLDVTCLQLHNREVFRGCEDVGSLSGPLIIVQMLSGGEHSTGDWGRVPLRKHERWERDSLLLLLPITPLPQNHWWKRRWGGILFLGFFKSVTLQLKGKWPKKLQGKHIIAKPRGHSSASHSPGSCSHRP